MKLFLGFLFILLDVQFKVGTAVIGVLPDFIGFFLVMKALERRNDKWRHAAFGLMLASAVVFVANLVDKGAMAQVGFRAVEFAAEIGMLMLLFHVVRDMGRLRELFPVVACLRVLCSLIGWIPLVGAVCTLAGNLVAACFLTAAYKPMIKER